MTEAKSAQSPLDMCQCGHEREAHTGWGCHCETAQDETCECKRFVMLKSEEGEARKIATRILDRINGDPDDELAILSRQLVRADERITSDERQLLSALADKEDAVKDHGQLLANVWDLEAENESLKAQLEKWESRVPTDKLSEQLRHGMNCGAMGFDGYDRGCCTCGLTYRIQAQTEQNLRTAWTKRAEEAEAERDKALEVIREYRKQHTIGHFALYVCDTCKAADALLSRETKET